MNLKVSNYNLKLLNGEKNYIINTYSGASLCLNNTKFKWLCEIMEFISKTGGVYPNEKKIAQFLFDNGFVVSEDCNELERLTSEDNINRINKKKFSLLIAPSLSCNMNCFYCYQGVKENQTLLNQNLDDIIKFVEEHLQQDGIFNIQWFGGEPLLMKSFIYEASKRFIEISKKKNAKYHACMISNCYLLDYNTTIKLKECKVNTIQVTFDGSEKEHDSIRKLLEYDCNGKSATFNKILDNIKMASQFIEISVRVNVSSKNIYSIRELIKVLADNGLCNKIKNIYFFLILNYKNNDQFSCYDQTKPMFLTMQEFAKAEVEFIKLALEYGFKTKSIFIRHSGCSSIYTNSYVIDSNGDLKKCHNEIGTPNTAFSTIKDYHNVDSHKLEKWINYKTDSIQDCKECTFLPICQSGCPHRNFTVCSLEERCPSIKYNWKDIIPLIL